MTGSLLVLGTLADTMAGDSLVDDLTAYALTYWLHSTLLLGSTWLLIRSVQPNSHFVRERLWKLAATAGLVTAAVQLATGQGFRLLNGSVAACALNGDSETLMSDASDSDATPESKPIAGPGRHQLNAWNDWSLLPSRISGSAARGV